MKSTTSIWNLRAMLLATAPAALYACASPQDSALDTRSNEPTSVAANSAQRGVFPSALTSGGDASSGEGTAFRGDAASGEDVAAPPTPPPPPSDDSGAGATDTDAGAGTTGSDPGAADSGSDPTQGDAGASDAGTDAGAPTACQIAYAQDPTTVLLQTTVNGKPVPAQPFFNDQNDLTCLSSPRLFNPLTNEVQPSTVLVALSAVTANILNGHLNATDCETMRPNPNMNNDVVPVFYTATPAGGLISNTTGAEKAYNLANTACALVAAAITAGNASFTACEQGTQPICPHTNYNAMRAAAILACNGGGSLPTASDLAQQKGCADDLASWMKFLGGEVYSADFPVSSDYYAGIKNPSIAQNVSNQIGQGYWFSGDQSTGEDPDPNDCLGMAGLEGEQAVLDYNASNPTSQIPLWSTPSTVIGFATGVIAEDDALTEDAQPLGGYENMILPDGGVYALDLPGGPDGTVPAATFLRDDGAAQYCSPGLPGLPNYNDVGGNFGLLAGAAVARYTAQLWGAADPSLVTQTGRSANMSGQYSDGVRLIVSNEGNDVGAACGDIVATPQMQLANRHTRHVAVGVRLHNMPTNQDQPSCDVTGVFDPIPPNPR